MKKKLMTMKQVRDLFFETFGEFKRERRAKKSHNDYSIDCRVAFCDFVDSLAKDGEISAKTAFNITLG